MNDNLENLVRGARREPVHVIATTTDLLEGQGSQSNKARLQLHHARGIALREIGETAKSRIDLNKALNLAHEIGDNKQWVAAAISLGATQLYAGEVAAAIALFEVAVARSPAEARGSPLLQLGTALTYAGDQEDALRRYSEALPLLQASAQRDLEADLLANRSVLMLGAGQWAAAIADATAAIGLFEAESNRMGVATTQHNKAIALFRLGNLAEALRLFATAEAALVDLNVPPALMLTDKSEALLAGGFFDEALRLSDEAASYFASNGDEVRRVEALVVGAEAALALADQATALRLGAKALASPATANLHGWRARAILALLRAEPEHAGAATEAWPGGDASQIAELPALFDASGQGSRVVEARLVAVRRALRRGDFADAVGLLDLQLESELARAPFHVVLERQALEAEASERSGNAGRAMAAVSAGLDSIDIVQATTGSFELRVHAARHAASLVRAAAEVLTVRGEADALAVVVERARSGALGSPLEEVSVGLAHPELTVALQELRHAEREDPSGTDAPRLRDRVRALTRRVAMPVPSTLSSSDEKGDARRIAPRAEELLLTYVATRSRLIRIEHWGAEGTAPRVVLADCGESARIEKLAEELNFVGRQMARRSKLSIAARSQLVDRHERLCGIATSCLLPTDLPRCVVLNPPPNLAALPWAGFGPLRDTPHVVSPSLAIAHQRLPLARSSAIVAGSSAPLRHVAAEVAAVSAVYGTPGLIDPDQSFVHRMGTASIVHLTGHFARSGSDPMFSNVHLGGSDVRPHDLSATNPRPAIVVLSTCESGESSEVGECALGFGSALLAAGTRSIVVSQTLVEDGPSTVEQMTALHRSIHAGAGPAVALAQVRADLDRDERAIASSWLTLGSGW